ncbi:uncharacterized protein LOC114516838 isoform X2 [Dendronephthya gigantea]|uniref:uncharacterized protein LOC114516838 isoform X2 n=1 Tax=Dendronephthya gigantea TaxID=151771 RepID=UPI00106D089A|nr:uncharacterized protein LOC114516838 isoform X2 [Dendronephthya gigantea]
MAGTTAQVALEKAIEKGILGPSPSKEIIAGQPQPLGLYYDLDVFDKALKDVQNAFGAGFFHASAVKTNPVNGILKLICKEGLGAECASIGEILNCLDAGFTGDKIVYDSPMKTEPEIIFALEKGIHINADNFCEIDIIAKQLKRMNCKTPPTIGLRVNPLIGNADGGVKELSCSSESSKFGVPMTEEFKKEITKYFMQHSWLTALHVHIGSQSYNGKELATGLRKAVVLALDINKKIGQNQICVFDIGGGYPVNRDDDTVKPTFYEYAQNLREIIPELFPEYGTFKKVITEFGVSLHAKAGWLASRVEYVKKSGDDELNIVSTHVGADLCMRSCYVPKQKKYQRRVKVFDKDGRPKNGEKKRYNIAGPLCFSGDVLKYDELLPEVERGDYIILFDCGSNSLSLASKHCSRFAPSVFGYRKLQNDEVNFVVLKEAQTKEELLKFWGGK